MARPVMIALLGVDGSGRTNQAKALAERLRRRGVRARYFENAGGRPLWNRLARALGAGAEVEADLALRTALPGDRYLLCSDGLSAVVEPGALHAALTEADDPESAVERLVELAYAAGAPDNIACVVADLAA
ncbi:hypothetical protein DLJ57_19530 [Micromonospora chalcea]|nr:hypothetical protein DLJ57_19530 [Micromonospora chalcea]